MLASSIVRHRPVRDYSCCVLDSAFCFRDSSLPAPFVMPSRRNIFNPAEAYVMTNCSTESAGWPGRMKHGSPRPSPVFTSEPSRSILQPAASASA